MTKIVMILSHPVNPDVRIEKEDEALVNNGYNGTILAWDTDGNKERLYNKKNDIESCQRSVS
jgi:hypothetical protein